jgi:hypothetical protein
VAVNAGPRRMQHVNTYRVPGRTVSLIGGIIRSTLVS